MAASPQNGAVATMEEETRWPEPDEDANEFLQQVLKDILDKGYSLINMPLLNDFEKQELTLCVNDLNRWALPKKEFEDAYLGRGNTTKYCTLEPDQDPDAEDDILNACDRQLTEISMLLAPVTEPVLGFASWGRISGMVRAPLASQNEDEVLRPAPLQPSDYEDGRVFGHLNFLERRKLSLLYFLKSTGGEVQLHGEDGEATITVPIVENTLLVWRHDLRPFSYMPDPGESLALQTWILSEPWEPDAEDGPFAELPEHMEQEQRVSVISAHIHTAGSMNSIESYWTGLMCSADGQVHVPRVRWDHDLYYSVDKSNTANAKHGAFVDEHLLVCFDHTFYLIAEAEMPHVSPAQRLVLDTGYETLNLAGYTKESLSGQNIGHFVGDSQSDWISLVNATTVTPFSYLGCSNCITAQRLSYVCGMRGPCQHIDTACSSSLVALDRAHVAVKKARKDQYQPIIGNSKCDRTLVTGLSLCLDPHLYIGYSGAGMLSRTGRCFTFDYSSNGFARGEGCASTFLQSSDPEKGHPEMMVAMVGSYTNQDGRSANMTAPNGPSQTATTRASLEESGFTSEDVSACECHGTGTPLGDPIEFSALRAAFAKQPNIHPAPLPHSSAKTNVGHGEANAGLTGFAKCVMMVIGCSNPGNNHLRRLNPNLDLSGYPAMVGDVPFDFGLSVNNGLMGVSSFGSGGTNARVDIWGRCQRGASKTKGLADYSDLLRKRQLYFDRVDTHGKPGPHKDDQLSLIGTWDAWSSEIPLMQTRVGEYTAKITLGETLSEQFQIVARCVPDVEAPAGSLGSLKGRELMDRLEKEVQLFDQKQTADSLAVIFDRESTIHPQFAVASASTKIVGPDTEGKDLNWKINGRADKAQPGTTYSITFRWHFDWERGESKTISWDQVCSDQSRLVAAEDASAIANAATSYSHEYFVVSSWTSWTFYKLTPSSQESGLYSLSARIGTSGEEEFQIVRDRDWSQVIYPARNNPIKTAVPVMGPDENGKGKNFVVRGPPGSMMDVELRMQAGTISVTQNVEKKGRKTWKSRAAETSQDYYVSGSWNNWGLNLMTPDSTGGNVFRIRDVIVGMAGFGEFRIIVDKDLNRALYPVDGTICGPDAEGLLEGGDRPRTWRIDEPEGVEFEIVLDNSGRVPTVAWSRV